MQHIHRNEIQNQKYQDRSYKETENNSNMTISISHVIRVISAIVCAFLVSSSLTACGTAGAEQNAKPNEAKAAATHKNTSSKTNKTNKDNEANSNNTQSVPDGYKKSGETDGGNATVYIPDDENTDTPQSNETNANDNDMPSTETNVEGSGLDDSIGESEIIVAN